MGRNAKVDLYTQELDNPLKDRWMHIRELVLAVDPRMEEDIRR
jgi:hypothetical protein